MKKIKICKKSAIIILITFSMFFQTCFTVSVFALSDNLSPTIPGGFTFSDVTYTSVTLCWTAASDNIDVKGYHVYQDGKEIKSTSKTNCTNNNLIPGRKYSYFIKAYDSAGNTSDASSVINVTMSSDFQAPTIPESVLTFSKSYTSVSLTWTPSTDNTKIKSYMISCSGKKAVTTSNSYYVYKGLTPEKTYVFSVQALDLAGNYSAKSNSISVSTLADNSSPSTPDGLKASSITGTEISLTWNPSSDNVKVKGYEIYCEGLKTRTTSKTSYTSKSLLPGKNYTFNLKAIDIIGNVSGISNSLTIKTQQDLEVPTAPRGLTATSINGSSVSLTWIASLDNIKVKGYHIFCNGFKIASTTKTYYTVKSPVGLGLDLYSVKAFDLVDNLSLFSNIATVIASK